MMDDIFVDHHWSSFNLNDDEKRVDLDNNAMIKTTNMTIIWKAILSETALVDYHRLSDAFYSVTPDYLPGKQIHHQIKIM